MTIEPTPEKLSDDALSLLKRAEALINATKRVSTWAHAPGEPLDEISIAIANAASDLCAAIAAHLEAGRPSLAQLQWRMDVAHDRHTRAHDAYMVVFRFAADDEYESEESAEKRVAAHRVSEDTYRAFLDAQRAFRSHPEWVPKNKKKSKTRR